VTTPDPQSVPAEEESNVESGIARWIPFLPLTAAMMVFCIFLIWAEVL